MKRVYDARSRYVHEGRPIGKNLIESAQKLCDEVLAVLLRVHGSEIDITQWLATLDYTASALDAERPVDLDDMARNGLRVSRAFASFSLSLCMNGHVNLCRQEQDLVQNDARSGKLRVQLEGSKDDAIMTIRAFDLFCGAGDRHKYTYKPKSRVDFWTEKFKQNVKPDQRVQRELNALGGPL